MIKGEGKEKEMRKGDGDKEEREKGMGRSERKDERERVQIEGERKGMKKGSEQ